MSRVMCHMSHVMSCFFSSSFLDKMVKLNGGGSVINGAYPVKFSVSYHNFFKLLFIENISFSNIFFFIMYLGPYRRTYTFILTAKINSEIVFFFVLNWSLCSILNFSVSYQIDHKTDFIVLLVLSFQNTWLNKLAHGLVQDL